MHICSQMLQAFLCLCLTSMPGSQHMWSKTHTSCFFLFCPYFSSSPRFCDLPPCHPSFLSLCHLHLYILSSPRVSPPLCFPLVGTVVYTFLFLLHPKRKLQSLAKHGTNCTRVCLFFSIVTIYRAYCNL